MLVKSLILKASLVTSGVSLMISVIGNQWTPHGFPRNLRRFPTPVSRPKVRRRRRRRGLRPVVTCSVKGGMYVWTKDFDKFRRNNHCRFRPHAVNSKVTVGWWTEVGCSWQSKEKWPESSINKTIVMSASTVECSRLVPKRITRLLARNMVGGLVVEKTSLATQ
jgi:hypothetical protein